MITNFTMVLIKMMMTVVTMVMVMTKMWDCEDSDNTLTMDAPVERRVTMDSS